MLIEGRETEAAAMMAVGAAQSVVGGAGAARLWIVACGATSAALAATLAPLDATMVWGKREQWGGVLDVGALGPGHAAHVAFTHMWTESIHTSARATAPAGASRFALESSALRVAVTDECTVLDAAEAQRVCIVWNGTSPFGLRVAGALVHAGARALLLVSEVDAPTAEVR